MYTSSSSRRSRTSTGSASTFSSTPLAPPQQPPQQPPNKIRGVLGGRAVELPNEEGALLMSQLQSLGWHNVHTKLSPGVAKNLDMTSSSNPISVDIENESNTPLWKYVTSIKPGGKGGNKKVECNLCHHKFVGSYSRVKAHIMRIVGEGVSICTKITPQIKSEVEKLVREAEERSKALKVPLPPTRSSQVESNGPYRMSGFEPRKRKAKGDSPLEKAFNLEAREQLRSEIARMFYSGGLPFHLARNPYYVSSYMFAANNNVSGFVPPGYNALRTTLLHKERANIERLLEPIKSTWNEKGVTLVSDGWSDPQRRPLINFMAVTESGPMFLRAVNCDGEYKDSRFIADLIKEAILEVGAKHIVQVVTDNAPVCKSAGLLIESLFTHIFWTPCVVHTLNLALKNICAAKNTEQNEVTFEECHWITLVAEDVMLIKHFITNHNMRSAMYNEFVSLKLLSVAQTRFASTLIMLKRFKLIKQGLQALVISEKWSCYREDDPGKAQFVKELILNDIWWDKIDYILAFTNPIYDMLRFADTDKPYLHLIYEMWDTMIEKVQKVIYRHEGKQENEDSSFFSVVHTILVDRWNKSSTPLHCLAHSLNPRYYSASWLDQSPDRVPPHKDAEISEQRNNCLRRYFPDNEERKLINIEYANFSGAMGVFSSYDSLHDRGNLEPKAWWLVHGSGAPRLQILALKLLGQPCSSSCSERNWSTYSFIHSVKRNKILPQRAEDLVYVHTNLRLLSRKSDKYVKGDSRMWDMGGDIFDPVDGAGELEIATLSLDEPEMEAMFLNENEMPSDEIHEEEVTTIS